MAVFGAEQPAVAVDEGTLALMRFLRACQLPEALWEPLLDQLDAGAVDLSAFKAVQEGGFCRVIAARALAPAAEVFLVPHTLCCTKAALAKRLAAAGDQAGSPVAEDLQTTGEGPALEGAFWRWARPAPAESLTQQPSPRALTAFYLEPRQTLWMRHAEQQPNMCVVALPGEIARALGGAAGEAGASIAWSPQGVPQGAELTRDVLPGKRSLQRGIVLLALLGRPPARWAVPGEYEGYKQAVEAAVARSVPSGAGVPAPASVPGDTKPFQPRQVPSGPKLRLWTDYPLVEGALTRGPFQLVQTREEADIVFSNAPVRDFAALPPQQLVNSFPYEACLIAKDLLPQTLRQWWGVQQAQQAGEEGQGLGGVHPPWYPPTYDLATDVGFFLQDHAQRAAAGEDNAWVVKCARRARSVDVCLTSQALAVLQYRGAPGGDRVVQKYVRQPVLYQGRKTDYRAYVAVRSFHPLVAHMHRGWYGRASPKPYSLDPALESDFATHFTVVCYEDDEALREGQLFVYNAACKADLAAQGHSVDQVEHSIRSMLRALLEAAAFKIGEWPRSRAIYAVDFLLEADPTDATTCVPQLLEVNYCPDFSGVLKGEPGLVNSLFGALYTNEVSSDLWQLGEGGVLVVKELDDID